MKTLLLVLCIAGITASPAMAQGNSVRYYGPNGQSLGTNTTTGNTTNFYGPNGAKTGSTTSSGSNTTLYGPNGQVLGHSYGNRK